MSKAWTAFEDLMDQQACWSIGLVYHHDESRAGPDRFHFEPRPRAALGRFASSVDEPVFEELRATHQPEAAVMRMVSGNRKVR